MSKYDLPREYAERLAAILGCPTRFVYDPEAIIGVIGPHLQDIQDANAATKEIADRVAGLGPDRDGNPPKPALVIRHLHALANDARMSAEVAELKTAAAEKALADVNSDIRYLAGQIPRLGPNAEGVYPTPMRALDIVVHLLDEAYDQLRGAKADARRMAAECADLAGKAAHYRERTDHLLSALRRLSRAYTALLATV
jgi:hypothetical protein